MRFLRRIRRGGMLCGSRIPNPLRFEDRMRMTFVTGRYRSYARSMSIIGRLGADTCRIVHCVFPLLECIRFTVSGAAVPVLGLGDLGGWALDLLQIRGSCLPP